MPNVPAAVFPIWEAILRKNDLELLEFLMRGDADRHYRASLGWPDLFTSENPYGDDEPIPLGTLRIEFDRLHAKDDRGIEEIWDVLSLTLKFPIFFVCNTGDGHLNRSGNIAVDDATFSALLEKQESAHPFCGGLLDYAGKQFVVCVRRPLDHYLIVAPADRFDLTR